MKLYLVKDGGGNSYIVKAGNANKAERLLGDCATVVCEASAFEIYEFDIANTRHKFEGENRVLPLECLTK